MLDYLRNLRKSAEEQQQEALNAYLDDALAPQQRQQVENELAADANLQADLAQMRALQQQMRQLPQRQVPRNFMLDPALYGRPRREPLIQAYPVLRTATVLTAFIFIFALAANVFLGSASNLASESAESVAMIAESAAESAFEEAVELEAEPAMEMEAQPEGVEEMVEEESDKALSFAQAADEATAAEQAMPAQALGESAFEGSEAGIEPQATLESADKLRETLPAIMETEEASAGLPAPPLAASTAVATEIARQLIPQIVPTHIASGQGEELASEVGAPDGVLGSLGGFSLIVLLLGIVLLILLVLTLMARRRL